jgi:GTPase SAR1 family protein
MSNQFNIVVCGSARVGKSTLINALCGRELAQTSSSLSSKTDKIEKYVLNRVSTSNNEASNSREYSITIWDTPGIESWTKEHVQQHLSRIMIESKPLCMIYCASPGSFARLEQLEWIIDTCIRSNIYCALVCTNKYSGGSEKREQLLNDFYSILSKHHSISRDVNNIKYYGDIALCASVNSVIYENKDFQVRKEVEGINELLFAITTSLKDDKLAAWCFTIADNESFWSTMGQRLLEFFEVARPAIETYVREHGTDIAKQLIPIIISIALHKK